MRPPTRSCSRTRSSRANAIFAHTRLHGAVKEQADAEAASGVDITQYGHSKVVLQTTESLVSNAAGGGSRPEDQSDAPENVNYDTTRTDR